MIVDRLENFKLYSNLDAGFQSAFGFLKELSEKPLQEGKYSILDNGEVYASVFSYCTCPADDLLFEQHQKYIDMHYIISGEETVYWSVCPVTSGEYNADEDVSFCKETPSSASAIRMQAGMFMVLFPDDLHKPKCVNGEAQKVEKVVVKIKI